MSGLASPWFHQKNIAPQLHPPKSSNALVMDGDQVKELIQRLRKPTQASRARSSLPCLSDTYLDKGRHSWSKMELCEDCKKCLWTQYGAVKTSFQT